MCGLSVSPCLLSPLSSHVNGVRSHFLTCLPSPPLSQVNGVDTTALSHAEVVSPSHHVSPAVPGERSGHHGAVSRRGGLAAAPLFGPGDADTVQGRYGHTGQSGVARLRQVHQAQAGSSGDADRPRVPSRTQPASRRLKPRFPPARPGSGVEQTPFPS